MIRYLLADFLHRLLLWTLGLAAGFALGTMLLTPMLASSPTTVDVPACQQVPPENLPGWSGLMLGPDLQHLTYWPRDTLPPPGSPWWRQGHDVWLTCRDRP